MIAWEDRSKTIPKNTIVTYSEATATTAGMIAWTLANTAMRKLCLNRTGWVIGYPLNRRRRLPCSRVAEARQYQADYPAVASLYA
jgi:hypothetical protein